METKKISLTHQRNTRKRRMSALTNSEAIEEKVFLFDPGQRISFTLTESTVLYIAGIHTISSPRRASIRTRGTRRQ